MSVKPKRYSRIVAAVADKMDSDIPLDYGKHIDAGGFRYDRNNVQLVYDVSANFLYNNLQEYLVSGVVTNMNISPIVEDAILDQIAFQSADATDLQVVTMKVYDKAICIWKGIKNALDHTKIYVGCYGAGRIGALLGTVLDGFSIADYYYATTSLDLRLHADSQILITKTLAADVHVLFSYRSKVAHQYDVV